MQIVRYLTGKYHYRVVNVGKEGELGKVIKKEKR